MDGAFSASCRSHSEHTYDGSAQAHPEPFLGSPRECGIALKKDVASTVRNSEQQYAYLNVIDQATFEELKRGGSLSATIPLAEILIGGSATYDEFRSKRTKLFEQTGYSSSSAQSEVELSVTTSEAAYTAFTECMRLLATTRQGFFAWKSAETKDAVVIEIRYGAMPGAKPIRLKGTVLGGKVAGVPKGRLFKAGATLLAGGSDQIQVQRQSGRDMSITIQGGGVAATPITSLWKDVPLGAAGTASVIVSRTKTNEEVVEGPTATSGWTANNHNKSCKRHPCSSDRRWQATRVELHVRAKPGTRLATPRFTCESSADPGVCHHVAVDTLEVRDGGQVAVLSLRASSRPARFTLRTKSVKTNTTTFESPEPLQSFYGGATVMFTVPKEPSVAGAVINVSYKGSNFAIKPGADAANGSLKFVAKIESPNADRFLYKAVP